MDDRCSVAVATPIGTVFLVSAGDALAEVRLPGSAAGGGPPSGGGTPPVLARAEEELGRYFRGELRTFTVPVGAVGGTLFRRAAWEALREIPYGETRSYAWVAARVGLPAACRAAGGACGANPLPIVVPCHRVVAADGSLGGYATGAATKRFLLDLERRALGLPPFP